MFGWDVATCLPNILALKCSTRFGNFISGTGTGLRGKYYLHGVPKTYQWNHLTPFFLSNLKTKNWHSHPAEMLSTAIQFSQTWLLYKKDAFGYKKFNSKLKCKLRNFFVYMVSCLFTKHLLTYCSLTIDDTEKLC